MKVAFLGIGLPHYYNGVLNKLVSEGGVDVFNIVDANGTGVLGDAVYQSGTDVQFRVAALPSAVSYSQTGHRYVGFIGLDRLLEDEQPDVLVTTEPYMYSFMFDEKLKKAVRRLGIKILLKDIPFRVDTYSAARQKITKRAYRLSDCWFTYEPELFGKVMAGNPGRARRFLYRVLVKLFSYFRLARFHFFIFGFRILSHKLELRKRAYCFPDGHVDYTDDAYEVFESYGVPRQKIFIIRNSPDTDAWFAVRKAIEGQDPILPENPHRFVHVGRLTAWKRVDLQLQALALLKKQFSDAELVVIGYGPEEKNLKTLADNLGVSESVRFVGGVYDPHLLGRYLLASSVYVLAGVGGISINDAMCFGKPIVCSVCDGTEKKLVRQGYNGVYFKEGDAQDLAHALIRLFHDQNLLKTMGVHSLDIIEREINIHTVINEYLHAFAYVRAH